MPEETRHFYVDYTWNWQYEEVEVVCRIQGPKVRLYNKEDLEQAIINEAVK